MKILVFGAGVIGSVYASRLYAAGYNTTLLARGGRCEDLKKNGVRTLKTGDRAELVVRVPTVTLSDVDPAYDLVVMAVRMEQTEAAIADLVGRVSFPAIVFMQNNPDVGEGFRGLPPGTETLLGFPGIGGELRQGVTRYVALKSQKTTLGTLDGSTSQALQGLASALRRAKFKVDTCPDMRSWLKIHAVFMSCVSAAILCAGGSAATLGEDRNAVGQMVLGVRQGLRSCEVLGMPVYPKNLKTIFLRMPLWFSVWYGQSALKGSTGTLAIEPHVRAAPQEVKCLAQAVLHFPELSPVAAPALIALLDRVVESDRGC